VTIRWRRAAPMLLAAALAACGKAPEPARPPAPGVQVEGETITFPKDSPQLLALRTAEAARERESVVRINGRVAWDETRTSRIVSPVAGRVVELTASAGATVRRGETLAVISSPEFGQAQSESRRADTDLRLAEQSLARARELYQAGVVPAKELQATEAEFGRARAERDRTLARERLLGGAGSIDQQFRLVAPIAGVVVERHLTIGQEVRPDQSQDAPLFVVSDPSRLWILLDVPEALTQDVAVGEGVRISVPALPGRVFEARVEYIADYIDPQTRMVRARAAVDNADRMLKGQMYVTAEVEVPPSTALRVPGTALFLQGDRYFAFVEEAPGRFARRQVRAEEASLGFMRVLAGLKPGDKVVADGALLLQQILNQKAGAPKTAPRDGEAAPRDGAAVPPNAETAAPAPSGR